MGRLNSAPPGIHAGNLDNKELVAGTTLYIPVHAAGALLEIGDGHAGQGNGEVDITALETSLVGTFQRDRAEGHAPHLAARRDADALDRDGNRQATSWSRRRRRSAQAIEFLMQRKVVARTTPTCSSSVACDVDVTQLVDGTVGVHVMIPKAIFTAHTGR